MKLSEKSILQLKKPLGQLCLKPESLRGKRIISIGDVCTLGLLSAGLRPHLAVFDFVSMRKPLSEPQVAILKHQYPKPKTYNNEPGTLSDSLMEDAKKLISNGGGVLINGEEDLTALAFILAGDPEQDAIIYGQPMEGMVVVLPYERIKSKIRKLLGT